MSTKDAIERLGAADVRLASALFSGGSAMSYDAASRGGSSVGGGSTSTGSSAAVYTLEGEARGDSADGRVLVALEGEATTGDGEQAVEMDCSCKVLKGQQVIVTVTGTHPVVTDVIGWGDGMQEAIDAGNEAIAEVGAAVQTVDAKAAALLAQLGEDERTLSEVHGALEDSDGKLIASAEVVQSVAALRSTMEADYQTQDAMGDYPTTLQMNSAISQSATDIKTNVLKDYATTSDLSETRTTLQSSIEQNAENIDLCVTRKDAASTYQTTAAAKVATDGLTATIESVRAAAASDNADVAAVTSKVSSYMSFTDPTGSSPKLTIGTTASSMKTEISNTAMTFKDRSGKALLTVDGSSSTVTADNLKIGGYRWQKVSTSHIQLVYEG